jgi:hypothetical protein
MNEKRETNTKHNEGWKRSHDEGWGMPVKRLAAIKQSTSRGHRFTNTRSMTPAGGVIGVDTLLTWTL